MEPGSGAWLWAGQRRQGSSPTDALKEPMGQAKERKITQKRIGNSLIQIPETMQPYLYLTRAAGVEKTCY